MEDVFRKTYRSLSESEISVLNEIKSIAEKLHDSFCSVENNDCYMELAKTSLEVAIMWAVKSITK